MYVLYIQLAFVLIFPKNYVCAFIWQTKQKYVKEKHVESSQQLVNRVPTSLYTIFVSVDFGKNMPDSCAAFRFTN